MKFLKKIFGLNGRLDRKGYLLLGVLPMVGLIFLLDNFYSSVIDIVALILIIPISILTLLSAVKRRRDSGINGLVTLFLFGAVPFVVIILNELIKIDIFYIVFLFIAYLLLIPSSLKEVKAIEKVEYVLTIGLVFLVSILSLMALPVTC